VIDFSQNIQMQNLIQIKSHNSQVFLIRNLL